MWVKVRDTIVAVNGNAIIRRDDSAIRLEMNDALGLGRSTRIASYVNPARAGEVINDFWAAVRNGEEGYEFPEV